jgi:hypothetical protein
MTDSPRRKSSDGTTPARRRFDTLLREALFSGALLPGALIVGGAILPLTGCSKGAPNNNAAGSSAGAPVATQPAAPPSPQANTPKETWDKLLAQAKADIAAERFNEAQTQLTELAKVYAPPAKPDEAQAKELAAVSDELQTKRKGKMAVDRAAKLEEAKTLLKDGKYEEARVAVSAVLNLAPTSEQETSAKAIRTEVDARSKAQNEMKRHLQFLASDDAREVAAARIELPRNIEVSLPLLVEASADAAKPKLVSRALAILVQLDRPKTSIPAMIAVLKRPEQKENWPDAILAIEQVNKPGAGEPLLELALTAPNAESKIAALTALSKVSDTPARTIVALLPLAAEDSPALAAVLGAMLQAVVALDQTDLTARRNLDVALTSEDETRLAALPARVLKLAAVGEGIAPEVALQAKSLAVALALLPAEPLQGVKVLRSGSELPESPAAAVLDGVWNSTEPASMWCYPVTGRGTIMLDLGEERTVTGVRIWNLNTAAAATLGWREVRIMVSSDPSEVRKPRSGLLPAAPGAAATPDYGVVIPTGFQRGRYVEIRANSLLTTPTGEGNSGLAEIQVLGF